jgi:hypothetical protein
MNCAVTPPRCTGRDRMPTATALRNDLTIITDDAVFAA